MAFLFHIPIKEIYLYPLGGISRFYMDYNISSKIELLVLIMGPIFQQIAYFILLIIIPNKKELIEYYHYHLLVFNLLPVYPLDGGKIVSLFLQVFFPFRISRKIIIIVSFLLVWILCFLYNSFTINKIVMFLFLMVLIIREWRNIDIVYQRFLFERYLKKYHFSKKKIIYNEQNFWRDTYHMIKNKDNYMMEDEYLKKKYDKS